MSLTCYCENYCPDQEQFNGTCTVSEDSYCFSSVELIYDIDLKSHKEFRTWGCLSANEQGLMQCRSFSTKTQRPMNITCCREFDSCNEKLFPQLFVKDDPEPASVPLDSVAILTISVFLFFGIVSMVVWYLWRHRIIDCIKYFNRSSKHQYLYPLETKSNIDMYEDTSGSGSGAPRIHQRTIEKEVELVHRVGIGRYGEVMYGIWQGGPVAVKVFSTIDEDSWEREKEIYQTALLRHENILRFIAADIQGSNSSTHMWLITDYHEFGSLYDYLQENSLDRMAMTKFVLSTIAGITHLHTEIFGKKGKPAIAHRDLKSKNILVKRDRECCIADFGLAVKYSSESDQVDVGCSDKVGTRRYMAPEVLDEAIKVTWFNSLKSADMYSYSLILWEICWRCEIRSGDLMIPANDYQLPYYGHVPSDPTDEEMREVVCVRGIRPDVPKIWQDHEIFQVMLQTMEECWNPLPSARLSALRVKKRFTKLLCPSRVNLDIE